LSRGEERGEKEKKNLIFLFIYARKSASLKEERKEKGEEREGGEGGLYLMPFCCGPQPEGTGGKGGNLNSFPLSPY